MGMVAIMFNGAKYQHPFDRRSHVKSDENCSSGFREEDFKEFTILYIYIAQGQGQITQNF